MSQPQGFTDSSKPDFVCKLHKSIYGLKQSPRAWFLKLTSALLSWGFSGSKADSSMFIYKSATHMLVFLVYVDDIIVTGSSSQLISELLRYLHLHFVVKDPFIIF